ncbi:DNA repair protein RecO [Bacillaceae bacterium SIJ1]|uniref:DNA repair protein RecO n=1 Tax=Litoribacterium kuwaitense TaxID=1398745 RepID=UPI0013EBC350|nr:DNA repair protein RecO [Litoribacterium kuwaitense]NGP43527.1 DNA repair protein RecO [Litoribacterium kuwaitense]
MLHVCEGIVLRCTPYGETHLICTLFTRERGKWAVMARGARKSKSKLTAVTQLFTHGHFSIRGERGMGTLIQGEISTSLRAVREDLEKTAAAACMVELTDRLTEDHVSDPALFEVLKKSLHLLQQGIDPMVILAIYETKLSTYAGIALILNQCAHCRQDKPLSAFSASEGGMLCNSCASKQPYAIYVTPAIPHLLRLFMEVDLNRLGKVNVSDANKRMLRQILTTYFDEAAGIRLKAKRFLEQLDRMNDEHDH